MSSVDLGNILTLPWDEAFAITANYNADIHPQKVSLGAGVYRDERGKPWVLSSVRKVSNKALHDSGMHSFDAIYRQSSCSTTLISTMNIFR